MPTWPGVHHLWVPCPSVMCCTTEGCPFYPQAWLHHRHIATLLFLFQAMTNQPAAASATRYCPGKGLYALFKDCTSDLHWRMSCYSCSGHSKWAPCILFADKPRKINLIYRLLLQQTWVICSTGNTCCSFITRKRLSKLYWLSFSPSTSQTVQEPFLSRFCSQ